jgi:hypothetical protein
VTKKYDDRTNINYFKETGVDDEELIVISAKEYNTLADNYLYMGKSLRKYRLAHTVAHDITQLMIIVRLLLASLLGLLLPVLFTPAGKTTAFISFYAMMFLCLVLSLFIPSNEVDASEMVEEFIQKK